ncbi:MAG: hypothetical protein LBT84_00540, partial [Spirochaetia bacterium]|nr:hypothetical protein [Spirochaetia bacterium]
MGNFLQSIKLEIGHKSSLSPYERIALHKVLGILKSNAAFDTLKNELEKEDIIRESAISILSSFPQASGELKKYLPLKISDGEKMMILENLLNNGTAQDIPAVIDFINTLDQENPTRTLAEKAFRVLRTIGTENSEVLEYLTAKADDAASHEFIRLQAILSLSHFSAVKKFEEIIRNNSNNALCLQAYRAIYIMNARLVESKTRNKDDIFSYSETMSADDDPLIGVRILLGKMAEHFESYSVDIKIAYICSMMSSNHREYNIYIMKALSSKNSWLVTGTLYGILRNIEYLNDPDKLFRNLLHVSIESPMDNDIIIDIFSKFFTAAEDDRKFNILKDRIYGYITIILQNDFETYRKEYLFKNVIEDGYSEKFQLFRKFVLEKMTPELKEKTIEFLKSDSLDNSLIDELAQHIKFVEKDEMQLVFSLVETIFEPNEALRKNSAAQIEDIDYERRYLKNRIIRLCRIIGKLKIDGAASHIVNSYNYLKKYHDSELTAVMEETLAGLNYSYLLGEIEILLFTGARQDQEKGLRLLAYFNEQRSINVLFEYIKTNVSNKDPLVVTAIKILLSYDLWNNISANEILKTIIESNGDEEIRSLAILGIGRCGFETEINYLNNLFFSTKSRDEKDAIVRAISRIARLSGEIPLNKLKDYFQEYLKDQGINVRIYSNLCLFLLGDSEAAKSIRDMLIIKNKSVQRKIISIVASLRSLEFSFFLVSLLSVEYGISNDIVEALRLLPEDDMREIDSFIVNLFKKYEITPLEKEKKLALPPLIIDNLITEKISILQADIYSEELSYRNDVNSITSLADAIEINLRITSFVLRAVEKYGGGISLFTDNRIIAFFKEPLSAVRASI